jgi:hypothetical protein
LLSLVGLESKKLALLWRGSRDGFGANIFHVLCDDKPNTITIVKNTKGYIFGGYTALAWSSVKGHKADNTAFLFSLTNQNKFPTKMKLKTPGKNAVYHNPSFGPVFAGGDLAISGFSNTSKESFITPKSYDIPLTIHDESIGRFLHGGSTKFFQVVEIEVFQNV